MPYDYETVITLQRIYFDDVKHEVTVKRINGWYNIRIYTNGIVNQEARCKHRFQISTTARAMLRMEDKCGNISKYASASRHRVKRLS